jgi:cellobiose phosphorylase
MISSWTVEMNYQAFMLLHTVYTQLGNTPKATEIRQICEQIRADFNTWLIRDGVVAGYGLVEEDRSISVLLHPTDAQTGIRYSILPMERGIISGIFTPEQAAHHRNLINEHLKGPDGARLMDKPLQYKGGIQEIFQRAESSTFFGREIGLMYIHEHIRYAESQAITGHAETFVEALRQANPVGYRDIVTCADLRQSNCYYSSSDVAFKSRYDADKRYAEINTGNIPLKGGWRVYSSGPGIYITLIIRNLLGLRTDAENIILDPVMPLSFDGLTARLQFLGYPLTFRYSVKQACHTPKTIRINGIPMAFTPEANPYRSGGAVLDKKLFMSLLREEGNEVEINL